MKPIILTFSRYYLPGYRAGGPIRSIENLVELLGDEFEFRIVAQDRDLGDRHPYPDIHPGKWVRFGKGWVRHVSPNNFGLNEVAEIVRDTPHDVIYLNSFFDVRFTQQILINRYLGRIGCKPIVLAPRGEFSKGALRIKRLKKCMFISLAKQLRLYDHIIWQASSSFESEDILREMSIRKAGRIIGRVEITGNLVIAPDLVSNLSASNFRFTSRERNLVGEPLRVCFISRICPKKNLDYALRLLSEVRVPIRFAIYGPTEDLAYWAQCETLIAALPPHIEVEYKGILKHADVVPTLSEHQVFLFPTLGENFGHVIFEALSAGLLLLISDQTPWRNLEKIGIGWDLPLENPCEFARRLEDMANWSEAKFDNLTQKARDFAANNANSAGIIDLNRNLFLNAITDQVDLTTKIDVSRTP